MNATDAAKFNFCSSLADDARHPSDHAHAYEWWYFDAISDDARDAVTVIFLDNFIFSPRYNQHGRKPEDQRPKTKNRFPALAFCYYRDGKPLYRAINEYGANDFEADQEFPNCRIGDSDFQFEATAYGVRYLLNINVVLRGGKRLRASLEWLAVERDFLPLAMPNQPEANSHFWNLAVPRADVTGKIEIFERNQPDAPTAQIQFRGTGYHDHNQDSRWLPATVAEWQWGRAHFADATAVFYRYREIGANEAVTKLFLVRENKMSATDAIYLPTRSRRHFFGVKHNRRLDLKTAENCSLIVEQSKVVDASFFYLRFLSKMRLDLGDGRTRETIGLTEHLAPKILSRRGLDWLINMRIGRRGKGAFLP